MLIFDWANDENCRQNSFNPEKIELSEHKKWFGKILKSDSVFLFILYDGNTPVGQVRIDIDRHVGIINYSIGKHFRGQGYGEIILSMIEKQISKMEMPITCLIGRVKFSNIASRKLFEKLGYKILIHENYVEFSKQF